MNNLLNNIFNSPITTGIATTFGVTNLQQIGDAFASHQYLKGVTYLAVIIAGFLINEKNNAPR
jgi:hypothetical protein